LRANPRLGEQRRSPHIPLRLAGRGKGRSFHQEKRNDGLVPPTPRLSLTGIPRQERPAALLAGAYFFCLLCSYYVLRPVRDEMGIQGGVETLPWTFTATFAAMLAATPLFGWAVARIRLRRLVPVVYLFFAAHLLAFYLALEGGAPREPLARGFFVWVSVFNLFVVSVFWSFMADLFDSDQAKRLFGAIAAGGSLGAVTGPLLTVWLAQQLGPANLLLVSCAFLAATLAFIAALLRWSDRSASPVPGMALRDRAVGGSPLAGLTLTLRSPYLLGVGLYIVLFTALSTFLYFEQARIVRDTIPTPGGRTQLFAAMDLAVNTLTLVGQLFLTGRVLVRYGLGLALAALPLLSLVGFAVLAVFPVLGVIVVFQVLRRACNFFLAKPAREALFTVISVEEKYKAKNFIDTVVYRGGDAASGWLHTALKALGLGATGISLAALPLALLSLVLGIKLGARHEALRRRASSTAFPTPSIAQKTVP
jgi:AAA family ATP:ADP antiporter